MGPWGCCELECWSGSSEGGSTVGRCANVGVLSEVDSVGVRALWVGVRRGDNDNDNEYVKMIY